MNWQQGVNEIISFLLYPEFSGWLLVLKYTFLGFGFFFLGYVIWALLKTSWLEEIFLRDFREFISFRPYYTAKFLPKWKKIEKRLESGIEADFKLAVLEADELLSNGLKTLGYGGGSVDEILEKITTETISNLEDLKKVRQLKRDIVEDPTMKLTIEETKKILEVYQKSLKDLQIL